MTATPDRPGRPFVIVPGVLVELEHLPTGPAKLYRAGLEGGWLTRAGLGLSYAIDTGHFGPDGNWDQPRMEVREEPQYEDDGTPILTPGGAKKLAAARAKAAEDGEPEPEVDPAWITVKRYPTEVPIWREWIAVDLRRGGARIHGTWERLSTGDGSWTPQGALAGAHGQVTATRALELARAQG